MIHPVLLVQDSTPFRLPAQVPMPAPTDVTQVDVVTTVRERRTEMTSKDAVGAPDRDEVQEYRDDVAQLWSPKDKCLTTWGKCPIQQRTIAP
jgi:hypothetical protein